METFLGLLMIVALAGIPIGLLSAIIKKVRKKPAKKSLITVGISVIVFLVAVEAFPTDSEDLQKDGEEKTAAVSDRAADNTLDNKSDEDKGSASEEESNTSHDDRVEYIGADLWLEEPSDFSEGRAFVQFVDNSEVSESDIDDAVKAVAGDDDDKMNYITQHWDELNAFQGRNRAALIDTQGKIIWKSEYTQNEIALREKSEFRDGAAYCIFEGNDKSSYYIIDTDGNVTFTKDMDEDYAILGHGSGMFLAAEHTADFDSNEWKIGAIDKNGDVVVPFQAYEKLSFDFQWGYGGYTCEYRGEGIFELACLDGPDQWHVLINLKTQKVIYSWDDEVWQICSFISDFEDGAATVLCNDSMEGQSICSLGTDGTFRETVSNFWVNYGVWEEFSDGLAFVSDNYSGGMINLSTEGAYYNASGEKAIDFPEYQNKNPYFGGPFQNGYAVMFLEGADGRLYITVINKKGGKEFEPMDITGFDMVYMSEDGKYLTAVGGGHITVFDVNGKALVSVEYQAIGGEMEYNVHDGVIRIEDFYVNVEDGIVIGLHNIGVDRDFSITMH